jgi:hypothetical protein
MYCDNFCNLRAFGKNCWSFDQTPKHLNFFRPKLTLKLTAGQKSSNFSLQVCGCKRVLMSWVLSRPWEYKNRLTFFADFYMAADIQEKP